MGTVVRHAFAQPAKPTRGGWGYRSFRLITLDAGRRMAQTATTAGEQLILLRGSGWLSLADQDLGRLSAQPDAAGDVRPHTIPLPQGAAWELVADGRMTLALCQG